MMVRGSIGPFAASPVAASMQTIPPGAPSACTPGTSQATPLRFLPPLTHRNAPLTPKRTMRFTWPALDILEVSRHPIPLREPCLETPGRKIKLRTFASRGPGGSNRRPGKTPGRLRDHSAWRADFALFLALSSVRGTRRAIQESPEIYPSPGKSGRALAWYTFTRRSHPPVAMTGNQFPSTLSCRSWGGAWRYFFLYCSKSHFSKNSWAAPAPD